MTRLYVGMVKSGAGQREVWTLRAKTKKGARRALLRASGCVALWLRIAPEMPARHEIAD